MAAIVDLVDDILCDIFSLTIQNTRIYPAIFTTGNHFQDCVSLIGISRVCRRWREVALTDSSLWSSIYIILDNPSTETLHKAVYFADNCFSRSLDLPLTCVITLSNLEDLRFSHPLIQTLIAHEARWSRITINLTPGYRSHESFGAPTPEGEDGNCEGHDLLLRNAGAKILNEFHFNVGSWLTYSMTEPLPTLSTLRLSSYTLPGCLYTLANWLPLTSNLLDLELTMIHNRFIASAADRNAQVWTAAARETELRPHFILPTLRTLNIWTPLVPLFTCPALEKYVVDTVALRPHDLTNYLDFIERSAPPAFRTIEIKGAIFLLRIPIVRGYLLSTITNLLVTSPGDTIFNMLTDRSEDGHEFAVLPRLEHVDLINCNVFYLPLFAELITSRWDIGAPHRTLKSVKLTRCDTLLSDSELLLPPTSDDIDLAQQWDWGEITRCVNEGLSLFACE